MHHDPWSPVRTAYNNLVLSLTSFRDKHIQLVSRYIVMASSASTSASMAKTAQAQAQTSDVGPDVKERNRVRFVGTGGTDLIPFLKKTRDTTRTAAS